MTNIKSAILEAKLLEYIRQVHISTNDEEGAPTFEELTHILKRTKGKKAAGSASINLELIKNGVETLVSRIHKLLVKLY